MYGLHDTAQVILQLLSNPILSGIGSVCSLISIPLAFLFARQSQRAPTNSQLHRRRYFRDNLERNPKKNLAPIFFRDSQLVTWFQVKYTFIIQSIINISNNITNYPITCKISHSRPRIVRAASLRGGFAVWWFSSFATSALQKPIQYAFCDACKRTIMLLISSTVLSRLKIVLEVILASKFSLCYDKLHRWDK